MATSDRIDEIRRRLSRTEQLASGGGFNPRYVQLTAELSEVQRPGRLFRQTQLALRIGRARSESLAALLDVQLSYADAMLRTYDWALWPDERFERIEQWVEDGCPPVDVNAWRASGAGVR